MILNRIEQKIKLLSNGYQNRGTNLWSQVESTFKLMVNAGTDLTCFQALHNQEQLAELIRFGKKLRSRRSLKKLYKNVMVIFCQSKKGCTT